MRKILGIIFLALIAFAGHAQSYQPVNTYGFQWQRGKFDKALLIPLGTGGTLPSDSIRDGAIRYNPTAAAVQVWKSGVWVDISTGGSVVAIDSARRSNDTLFFRYSTGGELAVKLDYYNKHISDSLYAITASNGLTKTGNDIALGGTFGVDGIDKTILGDNNSAFQLQGTSATDYTTDASTTQLQIKGTGITLQALDRVSGNLSQFNFSQSGITSTATTQMLFTVNNGQLNRIRLSQDSTSITAPIINFIGLLKAYNLQNNSTSDSILYTDNTGVIKQKKLDGTVDTVLTISGLQAYTGKSNLVVVKDTLQGGLFMIKGSGIVDNGITFAGVTGYWTRVGVNNAAANILWYGAIPNDGVNDNAAVTAAIATKRAVYVPDGTYLITSSQTLNDNQTIYGNGNTSVLQTTTANNIQIVNMGNYCTVRDLMFLGSGKGSTTPYVSVNSTQIGVRVLSKSRCLVSNCTFQALGGAGFYCQTTLNVSHEGSTVIACKADTCFNGFYSGTGGEYINYIACTAVRCDYGVTFLGGNNKFNSGTANNNQTGIRIISDRGNDAHGEVVGSTINHNYQYSVSIDSTLNSFYIGHNMMYYGKINIKKVINGVVFEGNDIASTDTIFINSSTNVQFVNNRFISTLPQFMDKWNGTSNTNPVTSDVQMFNNKFVNVSQYNQSIHPQNQLLGGANIYGNTYIWGTKTGILSTGTLIFQDSSGLRTGFYGDAASFDRNVWAACFNGSNIRFAGVGVDTANAPLTMNALFTGDGFFVFNDSIPYAGGYRPRFKLTGGLRADSFFNASTPNAKNHFQGTFQFDIGSDAKYDIAYRDSATGNVARLPAGTIGQVLTASGGGKPTWSTPASSAPSGFATTTDANYTVQANDKFILLIQTSSLRTLTLPNPAAGVRELWIRCAATGSGQWQTGSIGFVGCGQLGTPPFSPSSNVAFSSNTTIHLISDGTSWTCFN